MLRERAHYIGEIITTLAFLGVPAFAACVLWSFAVGAGPLPGLIAGGIFGIVFGVFIPIATHRPGYLPSSYVFGPILMIVAAIGGIVWLLRAILGS